MYSPYEDAAANALYNLLFCDGPMALVPGEVDGSAEWQSVLASVDTVALDALAGDGSREGRIRYLAFARLRSLGRLVPARVLLGVIVEVALAEGLDTLAAFSDGGVRYINQSAKVLILEPASTIRPEVKRLLAASETVVTVIGPWEKPRLAPPRPGNVRLSFLVSDGLYLGEGHMRETRVDPMAGPVFEAASALLNAIAAIGLE